VAEFLLVLPVLLFSVVAHEYAHAWTAYRQGDPTAYQLGRLTWNPLVHIDPVMSVLVPVALWWLSQGTFTFGAARPVPINPRYFRNYRRGDLIVSSAGIVANLALALVCALLFPLVGLVGTHLPALLDVAGTLQRMMLLGLTINLLLAFFNLVPLPPLDGSHLLYHALPPSWGARYRALGNYGFAVLMLTLWMAPGVWRVLLWPVGALTDLAASAFGAYVLPTMP
jgi:Zn-dependent protease